MQIDSNTIYMLERRSSRLTAGTTEVQPTENAQATPGNSCWHAVACDEEDEQICYTLTRQ